MPQELNIAGAIAAARNALASQRAKIDELNVYPVPDGDTGTNMLRTVESVLEEVSESTYGSFEEAASAVARSSLMGARGNAGVILSQLLRGACDVLKNAEKLDAETVAAAFEGGRDRSYSAVEDPTEGTMLTVIKDAASATRAAVEGDEDLTGTIGATAREAHASVERTPELLDSLRDAGVVDSGGLGIATILDGLYAYLSGEEVEPVAASEGVAPDLTAVSHSGEEAWGYCTQFVVTGFEGEAEKLEEHIREIGRSVLVISDEDLVRVHLHTQNPGEPLSYARGFGRLADISIEDMEAQVQSRSENGAPKEREETARERPLGSVGIVAMSKGEGNRRLFESAGAIVVEGGQGDNPSAADLAQAVREAGADAVILLPNNKNIIPVASQLEELVEATVHVVPAKSAAAGLSALVEFDPEGDPEEVASRMREALERMRLAEVTRATRSTRVEGQEIPEGAYMGLLDGELAVTEESVKAAAVELARIMIREGAEILTLLRGEDLGEEDTRRIVEETQSLDGGIEVELHEGGQPLYPLQMVAE